MMKLFSVLVAIGFLLLSATLTYAQTTSPTVKPTATGTIQRINLAPPSGVGISPDAPLGGILSNILMIVFIAAVLAVLAMLLIGGFQWITSGGNKEKTEAARKRITDALIGLAIIALAFLILNVVGQILNISITSLDIPRLGPAPI